MLTIKLNIKDKAIDEAITEIEEYYGVILTRKYFTSILKKHPKIIVGIWDDDFDTICREEFAEYLADDLTGLPWPLMGDSEKVKKKFEKVFIKAAKKAKIKLEDDWACSEAYSL